MTYTVLLILKVFIFFLPITNELGCNLLKHCQVKKIPIVNNLFGNDNIYSKMLGLKCKVHGILKLDTNNQPALFKQKNSCSIVKNSSFEIFEFRWTRNKKSVLKIGNNFSTFLGYFN